MTTTPQDSETPETDALKREFNRDHIEVAEVFASHDKLERRSIAAEKKNDLLKSIVKDHVKHEVNLMKERDALRSKVLQLKKENGELLRLLHDEGAAARWRLAQRGIHTQSPESLMKGI